MRTTTAALAALLLLLPAATRAAGNDRDAIKSYDAGKRSFDEGDFPKAIESLKASVAAKPNAKAYLLLGNAYTKIGNLDEAKKAFEEFLRADPKSSKKKTVEHLIRELDVLAKTKLSITSTPPGATVYLDLRAEGPRGKTPVEVPATPGHHRVMVDLEGYEPGSANVTAAEGQSVAVAVALKPKGCDLTVETTPPGALFQIDGQAATPAPATVRVATGPHELRLSGEGLETVTREAVCDGVKPFKVSVTLGRSGVGLVALRAPEGAVITVDGKEVTAAQAQKLELGQGEHQLGVDAEGKAPWRLTTLIRGGEKLDLAPRLETGGGASGIAVTADPPEARIRIDGKEGVSGKVVSVPPGEHVVVVGAPGHKPMTRTISILPGERARIEARLERRGPILLYVGLGGTALAVAAEVVALVGHARAGQELAGSRAWERWNATEIGGQVAAATFAAVAIAGYVGWLVMGRMGGLGDERPATRVGAAIAPGVGALTLTRSF